MTTVNLDAIDDRDIRAVVADFSTDIDANGIIRAPGKFEGEPLWTVYYWQFVMNGDGETVYADCEHVTSPTYVECDCESDILYDKFFVDATDGEVFPALADLHGREVRIREDSQGFVYGRIMTEAE